MKLKHIIIGLVSVLGIGAAVGAVSINDSNLEAKETRATPVDNVYYFENTNNWTNMYIHLWGGSESDTTWPGTPLTEVAGESSKHTVYKFENTGGWANFIINNSSGSQTPDLTFSGVFDGDKNFFWFDGTSYGATTTHEETYYAVGSEIGWGLDNAVKLTKNNDGTYYISKSFVPDEKIQIIYSDKFGNVSWAYNPSSVHCNHGGLYPVSIDNTDAKVAVAGTYTLIFNPNTKAYNFTYDGTWHDPVVKIYYSNGSYGETGTYASEDFQSEFVSHFEAGTSFVFEVTDDVHGTVFYGYEKLEDGGNSGGQLADGGTKSGSIKWINVTTKNTFSMYVKDAGTVWTQIADDSSQAYAFAKYFLANVGCDPNGTNEPTGWSMVSLRYSTLPSSCQETYFVNGNADEHSSNQIEQALARYDYAVTHHAGLTRFIVGRILSANPRILAVSISKTASGAAPIIVSVIAVISLTAIGGYYFLSKNKKKENQ